MDLKKLCGKISMKYAEGVVNTDEGEQTLKFPLLTVGDWGELKDKTGVDIWDLLLSVSSGVDDAKVANMTEKEIETMQRNTSLNLLKKIDQKTQVLMIYLSLRRYHDNVTMEYVDHLIGYGMEQQEYIKVVNFLLYGITTDQIKDLKEKSDTKNAKAAPKTKKATPLTGEQSPGEE